MEIPDNSLRSLLQMYCMMLQDEKTNCKETSDLDMLATAVQTIFSIPGPALMRLAQRVIGHGEIPQNRWGWELFLFVKHYKEYG